MEFVQLMTKLERAMRLGFTPSAPAPLAKAHGYKAISPTELDKAVKVLAGWGGVPPGKGNKYEATKPVTRHEAAIALDALYRRMEPRFLRKIPAKTVNLSRIKGSKADGSQAAMERLAKNGVLPYGSPIFEGPSNTVLPKTMSAVIAQAAERIGQRFGKG